MPKPILTPLIRISLLGILLGICCLSVFAAPEAHYITRTVQPGRASEITLVGRDLSKTTAIWSSFRGQIEILERQDSRLKCRITPEADTPVGIGALRAITPAGATQPALVFIDDLPSAPQSDAPITPTQAQALELPIVVSGRVDRVKILHFRVDMKRGQRLMAEIVADRLGSELDAVLRVLDPDGHAIAYNDEVPGIGRDPRLSWVAEKDGPHLILTHDIEFDGGEEHRYHLRVGNFPLIDTPWPSGVQRKTTARLKWIGVHTDELTTSIPAQDAPFDRWLSLAARYADAPGSGFTSVAISDLNEAVEPESEPKEPLPLPIPSAFTGRIEKPGDTDRFAFTAKKGQRINVDAMTRSIGSPANLYMRIEDASGKTLDQMDEPGAAEGRISTPFKTDGTYFLVVEELHRRGGPAFVYRLTSHVQLPGFGLNADRITLNAAPGETAEIKIVYTRRDYQGPIDLLLHGAPITLESARIEPVDPKEKPEKKDKKDDDAKVEHELKLRIPKDAVPGTIYTFTLSGRATHESQMLEAPIDTDPALQKLWPRSKRLPRLLDGAFL